MPFPHPIPWIFLLLVAAIGQWGILRLLIRRLGRLYPDVWNQLGRPNIRPRWLTVREEWHQIVAQHRILLLVGLPDRQTTLLVWCARFGYSLVAILLVLSFTEGPINYHFGN
jgi:hypothetical protein